MIVPIFPLPDLVLFPRTVLPLQVLEGSHRAMIKSTIEGDGKIVVALVREGWQDRKGSEPAVHEIACLANIENYEELADGKYNLVVVGIQRVRLVNELLDSPYRLAEIEPAQEFEAEDQAPENIRRRNTLAALFTRYTELMKTEREESVKVMQQVDLEGLVNTVASTLDFPAESKQMLLEAGSIAERCDMLIPVLRQQLETLVIVRRFEHIKPRDPNLN